MRINHDPPQPLPSPPPGKPSRAGARLGIRTLKHGFYSRRFRKSELTGLSEEIAMLRVCIRRVIEWVRQKD